MHIIKYVITAILVWQDEQLYSSIIVYTRNGDRVNSDCYQTENSDEYNILAHYVIIIITIVTYTCRQLNDSRQILEINGIIMSVLS